MPIPNLRLTCLALALGLLAACGGQDAVPPAAPVDPVAEAPVIEAEPAITAEPAEDAAPAETGEAGGAAHVHGVAELSLAREGNRYTAELLSPLANFGLAEDEGAFTDAVLAELQGLVELSGGECAPAAPEASVDTSGGHTEGRVRLAWTCARPDAVTRLRFPGFTAFGGFETVNAVYITDTSAKVGKLTASAPELSLK